MANYNPNKKEEPAKQNQAEKKWNDITGVCRVYGNDRGKFLSYSTTLSTKDQDGEYCNMYVTVQFPKGKAPQYTEAFQIRVTKGFLTCETWEDKRSKETRMAPRLLVQEYDFLGECK